MNVSTALLSLSFNIQLPAAPGFAENSPGPGPGLYFISYYIWNKVIFHN